ncbi:MAG TPA: DUF4337 family protein [Phycisphaerales bacterium]|nr:DUF4337 family protein [Phycisphaerales bacterium]
MTAKIPPTKLPKSVKLNPDGTEQKTLWDKVLTYTPVVMTVIATLLAGLSNSELNAAQYERAWAAQLQSKVADQWNFFQVKRIRGSALDNTLELLQNLAHTVPLDAGAFKASIAALPPTGEPDAFVKLREAVSAPAAAEALETAAAGTGPIVQIKKYDNPAIRAAIAAIEGRKPESEIAPLVRAVPQADIEEAITVSQDNVAAFDEAIGPTNRALDTIRAALAAATAGANAQARRSPTAESTALRDQVEQLASDFTAARLRYSARRYDLEASLNKDIAQLTEISVRKTNLLADHHKGRSQLFFIGMIIAQAAVIASTMALAVKKKSLLWGLATAAGLIAVGFGAYVRFYV